jgi:hypothetical protein
MSGLIINHHHNGRRNTSVSPGSVTLVRLLSLMFMVTSLPSPSSVRPWQLSVSRPSLRRNWPSAPYSWMPPAFLTATWPERSVRMSEGSTKGRAGRRRPPRTPSLL